MASDTQKRGKDILFVKHAPNEFIGLDISSDQWLAFLEGRGSQIKDVDRSSFASEREQEAEKQRERVWLTLSRQKHRNDALHACMGVFRRPVQSLFHLSSVLCTEYSNRLCLHSGSSYSLCNSCGPHQQSTIVHIKKASLQSQSTHKEHNEAT